MKKFKSGVTKFKLGKAAPDIVYPCTDDANPNKHINANAGDEANVWANQVEDFIQSVRLPPAQDPAKPKTASDAPAKPEESEEPVEYVYVPYGMYGMMKVPKKKTEKKQKKEKTPTIASDDSQSVKSKRGSIFSSVETKQASDKKPQKRPVDNFTIWDKDPVASRPTAHGHVASSISASGPTKPRCGGEADMENWNWPAEEGAKSPSKGKGRLMAIRDIDWSRADSDEILMAYGGVPKRSESISPADSGIGMYDEDVHSVFGLIDTGSNNDAEDDFSRVSAQEAALRAQMERYQREWDNTLRAIERQKEQLLERKRQEEADRIRAEELDAEFRAEEAARAAAEEARIAEEAAQLAAEEAARKAEEDRLAAEEAARRKDCVCCGDSMRPDEFPPLPSTLTCEHESTTCRECMHAWLQTELDTKGTEAIKCPECPAKLAYEDMQRGASEETFQAYEKILTRNALAELEEFAWCLSPTCNSGQLNIENSNFMHCISCDYKQCLTHRVAWHVGETCEAYEYRTSGQKEKDEAAANEKYLDEISKTCPGKKCGMRIQKIDGCDHMTCRKCRHEFCWECLASHREIKKVGNTAHLRTCKFHSENLDVAWPFNAHA